MNKRINTIKQKLQCITNDKKTVFGFKSHKLKLNKPLSVQAICSFESKYAVTLPEEYKEFLLSIANGGAGAGYGLLPLEKSVCYDRHFCPSDILSKRFDYEQSYNPDDDPEVNQYFEMIDRLESSTHASEAELKQAQLNCDLKQEFITAGTIVLCHEGCGYLHRLVVNGKTKGRVWMDATVSDQGLHNMEVGFLQWYENWLDHVLSGESGCWWFDE